MPIPTGLYNLDMILEGGFQNGYLYIIGGRPCMGKTALALSMLEHICSNEYRSALYFTTTAPKSYLISRILSMKTGINSRNIRTWSFEETDWDLVVKGIESFKDMKLMIEETYDIGLKELRRKIIKSKRDNHDLSVVIIDHLYLKLNGNKHDKKSLVLGDKIKELRMLAQEQNIPIAIMTGLTRAPEKRKDHRPDIWDLDKYANVKRHADVIMFLYRDDYYDLDSNKKGTAEINVVKNPMGIHGVCDIGYLRDESRFYNLEISGKENRKDLPFCD